MLVSGETKFSLWVGEYGARKLADEMTKAGAAVTVRAVYEWIRGEYEPRGKKLRVIVKLAAGRLTFEDLAHHFQVAAERK